MPVRQPFLSGTLVELTAAGGRPAADRVWQECFAQLAGTILSLWDASELDKVSPDQSTNDAEVVPTFINLTDAAIFMVCLSTF
jgi:CCR4-NOT transcriptional complex subunit CAF120